MTHTHVRLWLAFIICTLMLSPLFRDAKSMESYAFHEMEMTKAVFGESVAKSIGEKASAVYRLIPPKLTEAAKIDAEGMKRTQKAVPGPGVDITKAYNTYFDRLSHQLYVASIRGFIVLVWLFVLAPVFIAAVVDGFTQRAIKRVEFGAIRPAAFTVTSLIVVPLLFGPFLYLVIPISITPLITPMWALVTALPLALMISNMQPMFGKN